MSFYSGSWLRGILGRSSGPQSRSIGTSNRNKERQRGSRLHLDPLEPPVASGASDIDTGELIQPLPNRLQPIAVRSRQRSAYTTLQLERLFDRIAPAIITPFTVRYSINTTGDTAILGNTLETASTVGNAGRTQQDVTNAQNGTGSFVDNNDWNTVCVDMDGNSSTFNSTKHLESPQRLGTIRWTVLDGQFTSSLRNKVMLDMPAAGSYVTLTGTVIGDTSVHSP